LFPLGLIARASQHGGRWSFLAHRSIGRSGRRGRRGAVGNCFDGNGLGPGFPFLCDLDRDPVLLRILGNAPNRLKLTDDVLEDLAVGRKSEILGRL
jgi:hypothetical protein